MTMTTTIKLVATDIDGTIVRSDGSISARTVAALAAAREAGAHLVFVTGRPPRWMSAVAAATGHHGLAVCANGALLYDVGADEVIASHSLPPELVLSAAQAIRAACPDAAFAVETLLGLRREPSYQVRWDQGVHQIVGELPELLADDPGVVKLLCRVEGARSDELLGLVRTALSGSAHATHSGAADCLVEISAPGVSKATTLAEVAAHRGVAAADVVAFGDMPNDLEMLTWAGRGYAMSGGHPDVVAAADAVAPPCEEDGVAQVLEELLGVAAPTQQS